MATEHKISHFEVPDGWLITASSHLMDRVVPDCERIFLPKKTVIGGVLRYGCGPLGEHEDTRGRLSRLRRPVRKTSPAPQGAVFDLRRNTPDNWAHFTNNHLPIVFRICDAMGIAWSDVVLITPQDTPSYIRGAAELFNLRLVATDDVLDGEGIVYDADPWTGIRPERAAWVQTQPVRDVLAALEARTDPLPKRVFLSRKDTRTLENETEVAAWLAGRGFQTIYPEDLSPADQFRLFRGAEVMVAVHGAGLAPLLYAQPGGALRQLVEILPCGHMTDVYRVMAAQIGCDWIGVRGRLKPDYVRPAYETTTGFSQFSLDSFEVDLASLEIAFDTAKIQ